MRVAISTIGTFHSFDMARQMHAANVLLEIHTGYPRFKLRDAGIPANRIRTFPWLHGPYMAGWIPRGLKTPWEYWERVAFDNIVAHRLRECDVFCGLSGSALKTGRLAQARGARYICDRGSCHIRFQDQILREEHERWSLPYAGIDPRIIAREEAEYAQADAILVPSRFVQRSFVAQGVAPEKLRLAPYGVDLRRFAPSGAPAADALDVLFVGSLSVRKGAHYLFQAYERLVHPRKSLAIAGLVAPEIAPALMRFVDRNPTVRLLGHVPQPDLAHRMSRSHVLVLPSVEDGFGLVLAQAMACGCPVIASRNTGAEDLFDDDREGIIIEARDADALRAALQKLADQPDRRDRYATAARTRMAALGGWDRYGATVRETFQELLRTPGAPVGAQRPVTPILSAPPAAQA